MATTVVAQYDRDVAARCGERLSVTGRTLDTCADVILHPDAHLVGFVFIAIDMSFRFEWFERPIHYVLILFGVHA